MLSEHLGRNESRSKDVQCVFCVKYCDLPRGRISMVEARAQRAGAGVLFLAGWRGHSAGVIFEQR